MTDEVKKCVESYTALLAELVGGKMSAATFETSYLQKFKNELVQLPQPIFEELDRLFGDVDAYCADPAIQSAADLGDDELVSSARRALAALQALEAARRSQHLQ
jgi:hypothetical protein